MANIKPSDHGIVVEHKESGMRYAISDRNYNEKIHRKVRDLRPGESRLTYRPRQGGTQQASPSEGSESDVSESVSEDANQTEGS